MEGSGLPRSNQGRFLCEGEAKTRVIEFFNGYFSCEVNLFGYPSLGAGWGLYFVKLRGRVTGYGLPMRPYSLKQVPQSPSPG